VFAPETNHLGRDGKTVALRADAGKVRPTHVWTFGFDDKPGDSGDMAETSHRRQTADLRTESFDHGDDVGHGKLCAEEFAGEGFELGLPTRIGEPKPAAH